MSQIKITTAQRKNSTSKNLYGIFFEDINRAGDSGLYPEMIRNRTFEDSIPPRDCTTSEDDYSLITPAGWRDEFNHGEGLSRWIRENHTEYTPYPGWYANSAKMELERSDTLNQNRQAALRVNFSQNGYVCNTGFCGIPQKKGTEYHFFLFAKADKPIRLVVSIGDQSSVNCQTEIQICGEGYRRYDATLKAGTDRTDARLLLTCPEGGQVLFGFISLMPVETYNGHGLRKDIVEKLCALHPRFLRFPGGCIVEGFTPSTAMRFQNTVGPVWERPGHLLMWHYRTYTGLGFHEYLQLCEDLDMEPLYVANCGMTCQARCSVLMKGKGFDEMLQDVLDAVEYAVGTADSKWGRLRAQMGHPSPFQLNFIEIGNENFGPDYKERYRKFHDTISERYPWIRFIANCHVEKDGLPADIVDEHFYNTAEWFAEQSHFYDGYDRKGPKVFIGETAVVRGYVGQLYGALGEAAFMIGMERNQDVVSMASYAPLLENVNYNAWFPNLIRFNNTESFAIPSYYVWKMFGQNRGEHVVRSSEKSDILYRPVKGTASLKSRSPLHFRNAKWNGKEIEVAHELMGHTAAEQAGFCVTLPDDAQKQESARMFGVDRESSFVVFGEEEAQKGTFEIEVLAEEGKEFSLGVYSSRMPKEVYISDETHPKKDWNAENVKAFWWKIAQGVSSFTDPSADDAKLSPDMQATLKFGEFNSFRYEADGKTMSLSLNGKLIHQASVPSFPSMTSVACDTDDEVIVKAVNMSPLEDDIEILLDCDVESAYRATVLTGAKDAENTFESPDRAHDVTTQLHGASRNFTYHAPAHSVSVVVLKKSKMDRPM